MKNAILILVALLAIVSPGCVMHPHDHHYAHCPHAQRFAEPQHPVVGTDGYTRLLPDSVYRSWMREPSTARVNRAVPPPSTLTAPAIRQ